MVLGSIDSILTDIGTMLRHQRLQMNLGQQVVADRSRLSLTAVKNVEAGKVSSLSTFVRICRTLGKDEWILTLGPAHAVSIANYAKRGNRPRIRAAKSVSRKKDVFHVWSCQGHRCLHLGTACRDDCTGQRVEISESRLYELDGVKHFMTRRFDREGAKKHHIQTFRAIRALPPDVSLEMNSYGQLFATMVELKIGYEGLEEMFRRMAFNAYTAPKVLREIKKVFVK